jgi:hypothetical protein
MICGRRAPPWLPLRPECDCLRCRSVMAITSWRDGDHSVAGSPDLDCARHKKGQSCRLNAIEAQDIHFLLKGPAPHAPGPSRFASRRSPIAAAATRIGHAVVSRGCESRPANNHRACADPRSRPETCRRVPAEPALAHRVRMGRARTGRTRSSRLRTANEDIRPTPLGARATARHSSLEPAVRGSGKVWHATPFESVMGITVAPSNEADDSNKSSDDGQTTARPPLPLLSCKSCCCRSR